MVAKCTSIYKVIQIAVLKSNDAIYSFLNVTQFQELKHGCMYIYSRYYHGRLYVHHFDT